MDRIDQQLLLPDGRRLGYSDHGPLDGWPIFYFHGAPSARVEFDLFGDDDLLRALGARIIALDRPGAGLSDLQPDRRLLDWPQDIIAAADSLGFKRFSILAYSLGGPYGLACAYAIPERLKKVGIVSGAALFTEDRLMRNLNKGTRRYLNLPKENPLLSKVFIGMMRLMARFLPGLLVANASALLPTPDRAVAADPAFRKTFIKMVREALRQGTRGARCESLLAVTDWGFRLQDITVPPIFWHGGLDQNIPMAMAREAAAAIPGSTLKAYPQEGHLSLIKMHLQDIIQSLLD